jgi:Leucine-rich repeat (LRR) protein
MVHNFGDTSIKNGHEIASSSFKRLLWLNLDNNHLRDVPVASLPPTIVTLSITNNYITKFPLDVTNSLPSLTWFTLRGNYIETLPGLIFGFNFLVKQNNRVEFGLIWSNLI